MTVAAAIDSSAARRAMIDGQLRVSGISQSPVLAAIAAVARENFVPAAARGHAYIDRAISLDQGHALPAPLVQAMILENADLAPADRVLVVSCGSGYLAALVEAMGASVEVSDAADAAAGKPGGTGYSLILIDGAIEHLPAGLVDLLGEGGRVVTGLVRGAVTSLATGRKQAGAVTLLPIADIGIPVLQEFAAPTSWSF
ncbi:MAG: protein-L-isoaspartate O-methyltransferase [Novosphingobium sp.]|uniref:protein-L-isoaspartate O-methyltransferase family protein n=1 Tax=Novosphingobium sp. TaxID=1874826 RepID=UPI0032BE2B16